MSFWDNFGVLGTAAGAVAGWVSSTVSAAVSSTINADPWAFSGASGVGEAGGPGGPNLSAQEDKRATPKPDIATLTPIDQKMFKFNPPLHVRSRSVRVDFGGGDATHAQNALTDWYDEAVVLPGANLSPFMEKARLGRFVQAANALGAAANSDYRWGFRFMYNPPDIVTTTKGTLQVALDTTSEKSLILTGAQSEGMFQSHQINLLLNRVADLEKDDQLVPQDYAPYINVDAEEIAGIRRWGTMWDLEYIWRMCNGVHELDSLGKTGNLGVLQPSGCILILGPGINHYGYIASVGYQHRRFSVKMVPTVTEVSITFQRMLYMPADKAKEWHDSLGIYGTTPQPKDGASGTAGDPNAAVSASGASVPYEGTHPVTAGMRYSSGAFHGALDISMPIGTHLLAARDGIVTDCHDGVSNDGDHGANSPSNWITLVVNWKGQDTTLLYQHLSPGLKVQRGQAVKAGQYIGDSGQTGHATGPHLHIAANHGRKTGANRYDYMKNDGNNADIIFPPSDVWEQS